MLPEIHEYPKSQEDRGKKNESIPNSKNTRKTLKQYDKSDSEI